MPHMDSLIGTPQCPHLGYDIHGGLPCCHADDMTRSACGKFAPNPAARRPGSGGSFSGIEPYFCTVLGTDSLPAESLRLAAQEKARAKQAQTPPRPGFRAPSDVTGQMEARPAKSEHDFSEDRDPVIPTHTLKNEPARIQPNAPCPCGSGKKHKKCCGRLG
jgi:SEC-C motif